MNTPAQHSPDHHAPDHRAPDQYSSAPAWRWWRSAESGDTQRREITEAVKALGAGAAEYDGAPPFYEQTLVDLAGGESRVHVLMATAPAQTTDTGSAGASTLAAAAVVVAGTEDSPGVLELAVAPEHRGTGLGTALISALQQDPPVSAGSVRAWAHGGHGAGPQLAAHAGWTPVRELWRMRLQDSSSLRPAAMPPGVQLRAFSPGTDEQAWLRANAAAFADHPEQGQLTLQDLQARMDEDWFDPAGFLLAWEGDDLLGFHWTKIPPPANTGDQAGQRWGEVYAVGVVPGAQGRGLGKELTLAGLHHLLNAEVDEVVLYVDADNAPAVAVYKGLGFSVLDVDIQYAAGSPS